MCLTLRRVLGGDEHRPLGVCRECVGDAAEESAADGAPAALAAPGVEERRSQLVKTICDIHREDIDACTAVQRAVRSGVSSTGRLSHLERPLWEFYRYLGRELGINATSTLASTG